MQFYIDILTETLLGDVLWVQRHQFKANNYRDAERYVASWMATAYNNSVVEYRIGSANSKRCSLV